MARVQNLMTGLLADYTAVQSDSRDIRSVFLPLMGHKLWSLNLLRPKQANSPINYNVVCDREHPKPI